MKKWILVFLMAAGFCSGCDTFATSTGEHNQPCFGDGTCLEGFFCEPVSGTCLLPEEDCGARECGLSPNLGLDCGTCTGATDYCVEGQCEDDCAGRVCGQSPNEGFDCGTCSGSTDYCVEGQCEDDCAGRECGQSPNVAYDCGTCTEVTENCIFGQCVILEWQEPPEDVQMTWQQAIDYCASLSLDGYSDWHLPSISELRALIRGCPATETGGPCGVTNECLSAASCRDNSCEGCTEDAGPVDGCYWPVGMLGQCLGGAYWSSSLRENYSNNAWFVYFDGGRVSHSYNEDDYSRVRCVRHGD